MNLNKSFVWVECFDDDYPSRIVLDMKDMDLSINIKLGDISNFLPPSVRLHSKYNKRLNERVLSLEGPIDEPVEIGVAIMRDRARRRKAKEAADAAPKSEKKEDDDEDDDEEDIFDLGIDKEAQAREWKKEEDAALERMRSRKTEIDAGNFEFMLDELQESMMSEFEKETTGPENQIVMQELEDFMEGGPNRGGRSRKLQIEIEALEKLRNEERRLAKKKEKPRESRSIKKIVSKMDLKIKEGIVAVKK